MIIHISRARYDAIQSQGFRFPVQHPVVLTQPVKTGDNEIHLLDGERANCPTCGSEFDSVEANTPAEWEEAKLKMKEAA